MERLLTSLVNQWLQRFIKRAGDAGNDVRVSLSGGKASLHNLELDLSSLLQGLPITVSRAFAKQLTISVPWTALSTQPIQLVLDTVEVIVDVAAAPASRWPSEQLPSSPHAPADTGPQAEEGPGTWMESLSGYLVRVLADMGLTLRNLVLKLRTPSAQATLACDIIRVVTASDDWRSAVPKAERWLKKVVEVRGGVLCLDQRELGSGPPIFHSPLLRTPQVQVGLLLPLFELLEGGQSSPRARDGPRWRISLDLSVGPCAASLSPSQLTWLLELTALLCPAPPAAQEPEQEITAPAHEQEPLEASSVSRAGPALVPPLSLPDTAGEPGRAGAVEGSSPGPTPRRGPISWLARGAVGAAGALWTYVTDEAAAAEGRTPEDPSLSPVEATPVNEGIDVTISLAGGKLTLTGGPRSALDPAALSGRGAADEGRTPRADTVGHDFTDSEGATPRGLPPGVSYFGNARSPASAIARLDWGFVEVGLGIDGERLTALDVSVAHLALLRRYTASGDAHVDSSWDHVIDLCPAEAIESVALTSPSGEPLALRLVWRPPDVPPAGVPPSYGDAASPASPEVVSVSVGCVSLVYPPGFASRLFAFFASLWQSPAEQSPHAPERGRGSEGAPALGPTGGPVPEVTLGTGSPGEPRWLLGGLVVGVSVMSIHLAALSGEGPGEAAVVMGVSRLSAHLGHVRTSARPGGLVAELYGIQAGPVPQHGLRVSAVGLQLGAAIPWVPRAGSVDRAGDADDDVELPPGAWPVSDPFEVQALLAGSGGSTRATSQGGTTDGPQGAEPLGGPAEADGCAEAGGSVGSTMQYTHEDPHGWVLSVAVAPVSVRLKRSELAVLAAVADALAMEAAALGSRSQEAVFGELPDQALAPEQAMGGANVNAPAETESWVDGVGLDVQGLWCVAASEAMPGLISQPCDPHGSHVIVQCREAVAWLQGASSGVAVRLPKPRFWMGQSSGVHLPGFEVHMCDVPPSYRCGSPPAAQPSTDPATEPPATSFTTSSHSPPGASSDLLMPLPTVGGPQNPVDFSSSEPCVLVTRVTLDWKSPEGASCDRRAEPGAPVPMGTACASICDVSANLSFSQWRILTRLLGTAWAVPLVPCLPARSLGAPEGYQPPACAEPVPGKPHRSTLQVTRISIQVETEDRGSEPARLGLPTLSSHMANIQAEHSVHTSQAGKEEGRHVGKGPSPPHTRVSSSSLGIGSVAVRSWLLAPTCPARPLRPCFRWRGRDISSPALTLRTTVRESGIETVATAAPLHLILSPALLQRVSRLTSTLTSVPQTAAQPPRPVPLTTLPGSRETAGTSTAPSRFRLTLEGVLLECLASDPPEPSVPEAGEQLPAAAPDQASGGGFVPDQATDQASAGEPLSGPGRGPFLDHALGPFPDDGEDGEAGNVACFGIVLRGSDVVLLSHDSLGTPLHKRVGGFVNPTRYLDISLLGVGCHVLGPGLQVHGVPVLDPCDMHALVAQRGGPQPSLTLALDAPALGFCLTPSLPEALSALSTSLLEAWSAGANHPSGLGDSGGSQSTERPTAPWGPGRHKELGGGPVS
eukprot:jgi/Botrbrau1/21471/Bobra.0216s0079.1